MIFSKIHGQIIFLQLRALIFYEEIQTMKKHSLLAFTMMTLFFLSHLAQNISAVELITNGGFETGTFAGWTTTNASGGFFNWANAPAGTDICFCNSPTFPQVTSPQEGTRSAINGVTANANSQYIMYQQITVPAASTASVSWKDRFQMDLVTFCTTCGQAFYVVDITNTSGTVLQTLYTVTAPTLARTDTGWVTHFVNLSNTYAGQTIRIRFRSWGTVTFAGPGQAEIDAVSVNALPVLAAEVSVGGRIQTANGNGIRNVSVALTAPDGTTRTTLTNAFGYYNFDNVEVGENYLITVNSKRYTFPNPTRLISVTDNISDADFISIE